MVTSRVVHCLTIEPLQTILLKQQNRAGDLIQEAPSTLWQVLPPNGYRWVLIYSSLHKAQVILFVHCCNQTN